jgi:cytochrome b561
MTLPARYTKVAILLHWIVTVLILANFALILAWENVGEDQEATLVGYHMSIGLTVFGFVVIRILWRLTHPAPAFAERYARWEKMLAHAVHGLLYLLTLGVPIGGYLMLSSWKGVTQYPIMWFGLFEVPALAPLVAMAAEQREAIHHFFEEAHELAGWTMLALIVLHVVGALKHQFIDKEPELQRMLLREPKVD